MKVLVTGATGLLGEHLPYLLVYYGSFASDGGARKS